MALFLGLYLGHLTGDFVFQPGRLVLAKRRNPGAAILHVAIVTACTALVLAGSLGRSWPAVLLAGITHLAVEYLTISARRADGATGLTLFLLDQALHISSLALIAIAFGRGSNPVLLIWQVPIEALAFACALTAAGFGGSILVFEVDSLLEHAAPASNRVLGLDAERIAGVVERIGALVLALAVKPAPVGLVAFVPRVIAALFMKPDDRRRASVAAGVGMATCMAAYLFVMLVTAAE